MGSRRATRRQRAGWMLVAVLVVLALVGALTLWLLPRLANSPEAARRAYVEALADGDADTLARVTGLHPRDLRGLAAMHEAGGLPTNPGLAGDAITFDLDGEARRVVVPVEQVDGRWRVTIPAASASLAGFPAAALVDGRPALDPAVSLVPGVHAIASADPHLSFEPVRVVVVDPTVAVEIPRPAPALTDAGLDAVRLAVAGSLRDCLARKGLVVPGCPNAATPPPNLLLAEPEVTWHLDGADPTSRLTLSLAKGSPWGSTNILELPLVATAPATRTYDATATTYRQPLTVRARAFVSLKNGRVEVTWTTA